MKYSIIVILLILTGCGSSNTHYTPGIHRAEVMDDLKITDLSDAKSVVAKVREYVYLNNIAPANWPLKPPFGPVSGINTKGDFYNQYIQWKAGQYRFECGELGYVQEWMLEELGIPAHDVALATVDYFNGNIYTTHVTTEAYFNNKWSVTDATFNVTLQCNNGEDASIHELKDCLNKGGTITWHSGPAYKAPLSLEEYTTPIANLIYAYQTNYVYKSRLKPEPDEAYPYPGWIH